MPITYRATRSMADAFRAFPVIRDLSETYPDFADWYVNKLVPDVALHDGVLILAEDGHEIVGLAAGRSGEDAKLRCIRVIPRLQARGVGIHLLDRCLSAIGNDRPLTTVSEGFMHDLSRVLVNRFEFSLTKVERGLYKPGVLEYVFNGRGAELRERSPYGR